MIGENNESKQRLLTHLGFTLVETLIGLGVMGIVAVGLTVIITSQNVNSQNFNLFGSRLSLARVFNHAIRNGKTLLQSATYNSTVPNNTGSPYDFCLNGTGGPNGCVARDVNGIVYHEFYLLDVSSTVRAPLAGPAAANVLYDINGSRCPAPTSKCFMQAFASFNAICPGAAASCSQAQSVRITFSLKQLANLNAASNLRPVSGTYSLQVANIVASGGVGSAGFIPYWDSGGRLANSLITQALPATDIGMSAQSIQVNGNANFFQNVAVALDGIFDKDLGANGDYYTGDIVGYNTNMASTFKAFGDSAVQTGSGINGNLWTGAFSLGRDLTCNISITAPMFFVPSDQRLKQKIKPIHDVRSRLLHLRGVSFEWLNNGSRDVGFIAQQVQTSFPELIAKDREGHLTVSYVNLIAPLSESIKLDSLDSQRANLLTQRRIQSIQSRLNRLAPH